MKRAVSEPFRVYFPVCHRECFRATSKCLTLKKKMEEGSGAVELALENHNLFFFICAVQEKCFNYSETIIFIFFVPL